MKSYIKLIGPSIDRGIDALNRLVQDLGKRYQYGDMITHIVSTIDPRLDLRTGTLISRAGIQIGDYDFVVQWKENPNPEQVRSLVRSIDEALLYTGCRYTITTKE